MNTCIFVTAISILTTLYFIIGLVASQKVHNTTDYFLAGKKLGVFAVGFTLVATQLGGGFFLGMGGESYSTGYFGVFYALSMGVGFIMLSFGFASRIQSMHVSTTAEIFDRYYKSPFLKKFASLLSIATMCGILIAQIISTKTTLIFLLGNTPMAQFFFIFFWSFLIIYTIVGGLKAVVMTDAFQVGIILILFVGVFIYSIVTQPSAWFFKNIALTQHSYFPLSATDIKQLFATLLMPALFSLIEQDLAQRFLSARSKRVATLSAMFASIVLLGCALIPVYFGMLTRVKGLALIPGASPLLPSIASITSSGVLALVFCALLAAITSTADSLLCAISSNIAQDFDFSWLTIKNRLRFSQVVTCITGVTTVIVSYFFTNNIIDILYKSYEISVSALFVPLVVSYFKKDLKTSAAYGAVIFGFSAFVFFKFYPLLGSTLIILALSGLGFIIGTKLEKKA